MTKLSNKQKRELIETLTANIALQVSQLLTVLFTTDEITTDLTVIRETPSGNGGSPQTRPDSDGKKASVVVKARKPGKAYKAPAMPKKNDVIIWNKKKWRVTSLDPNFPTNFNAIQEGQMGRPSTFAWEKVEAQAPASAPSPIPAG